MEIIQGSRCPACGLEVAPRVRICPRHPIEMMPAEIYGYGSVLSYTTLTSAPEGFKAPLHMAVVELASGARIFCHGKKARDLKIGRVVSIEQVDGIFYFAQLGLADRVVLFWKRRGAAPERTAGALKSAAKRFFNLRFRMGGGGSPPSTNTSQDDQKPGEPNNRPTERR